MSSAVQNYDFILKSGWNFPVCMIDIFDLQVCDKHMMRVSRQVYNISVLKHFQHSTVCLRPFYHREPQPLNQFATNLQGNFMVQ